MFNMSFDISIQLDQKLKYVCTNMFVDNTKKISVYVHFNTT